MKFKNLINLIILELLICSCGNNSSNKLQDVDKIKGNVDPIEVNVKILKKQDFKKQLISNGKIVAMQKVILRPQISGILSDLRIKNGQYVKKGDTLAILENSQQKIDLEKAYNEIKKTNIEFKDALLMAGFRNSKDTLTIKPELLEALRSKSGCTNARLGLRQSLQNFQKTFLLAPFSGVIANLKSQVHDFISSSEFCTLYNDNNMAIDFKLLEMEIGTISVNQKVSINPFNRPDLHLQGIITEINPIVDENGLVTIKARIIKDTKTKLFAGINARIFIEHSIPNQYVIPREALVLRSNREVVFHYEKGLSKWVYVKVLYENEKQYAIEGEKKGNLKEGYQIIVTNNLNLAHDAQVTLKKIKN